MPSNPTTSPPLILEIASEEPEETVGIHRLRLLRQRSYGDDVRSKLRAEVRVNFQSPATTVKRLLDLGLPETARIVLGQYPIDNKAMSGNSGEILAVCAVEALTPFQVPIRRLQWTDGRNMSLRGDDFIGVDRTQPRIRFLKGESKSGLNVSRGPINDADTALNRDQGRPTPHSLTFTANRLREQAQDELALKFEEATFQGLRDDQVEHMIFLLSGTDPTDKVRDHLSTHASAIRRQAVTMIVSEHAEFVRQAFEDPTNG